MSINEKVEDVGDEVSEQEFSLNIREAQKECLKVISQYTKKYHQIDSIFMDVAFLQSHGFSVRFYKNNDGYTYSYAEKGKVGFKK